MNKKLIELSNRAREVLLKKALISSEVTRDIAVDALFEFADSGDFLSLIQCAEAAEQRAAVEHEASCNLVVELSAANKRIHELESDLSEWTDCKHDGAVWYDFSGRERCGKCGGDV
jgi:hypothetical protein